MCHTKILKNMVGSEDTETISGILKQTNTLDGKPLLKRR
jgi:hypothetical protein